MSFDPNHERISRRGFFVRATLGAGAIFGFSKLSTMSLAAARRNDVFDPVFAALDQLFASLPVGPSLSAAQVDTYFGQSHGLRTQLKQLAIENNVNVTGYTADLNTFVTFDSDEAGDEEAVSVVYDWSLRPYAEIVAEEQLTLSENEDYVSEYHTLLPDFDFKKFLAKALGFFGLRQFFRAFDRALAKLGRAILDRIRNAIAAKNWGALRDALKDLFDLMRSDRFLNEVGRIIGRNHLRLVISRLLGKFLPIIGWGLLIFDIAVAIINQFVTSATLAEA